MNYAIIAAGEGSRLVQEGVALPKPLVDLDGRPMIKRLIDLMMEVNPESLSIIVNEQMTQVREYLENLTLPVPFHLVVKSTPSSMHSFYEVSRAFPRSGKFVLTTVDTIFRADDFRRYVEAFEADTTGMDGYMGVTDFIDDEKPLYIDVDAASMEITAFRDEPWADVRYISGGIYGLTAPALEVLDDCIASGQSRMRNYQRALVASGLHLRAFPFSKIIDVDHAGDIATAREFIAS
jgi:NDP-sugar pyrophosphorylase family protein